MAKVAGPPECVQHPVYTDDFKPITIRFVRKQLETDLQQVDF